MKQLFSIILLALTLSACATSMDGHSSVYRDANGNIHYVPLKDVIDGLHPQPNTYESCITRVTTAYKNWNIANAPVAVRTGFLNQGNLSCLSIAQGGHTTDASIMYDLFGNDATYDYTNKVVFLSSFGGSPSEHKQMMNKLFEDKASVIVGNNYSAGTIAVEYLYTRIQNECILGEDDCAEIYVMPWAKMYYHKTTAKVLVDDEDNPGKQKFVETKIIDPSYRKNLRDMVEEKGGWHWHDDGLTVLEGMDIVKLYPDMYRVPEEINQVYLGKGCQFRAVCRSGVLTKGWWLDE